MKHIFFLLFVYAHTTNTMNQSGSNQFNRKKHLIKNEVLKTVYEKQKSLEEQIKEYCTHKGIEYPKHWKKQKNQQE